MQKIRQKSTALLLSLLMILSCFGILANVGIGSFRVAAIEGTGVPGDINGDGTPNNKDLTRLMRFLAGDEVEVVDEAIDTNGDGTTNNKDLTRLMRYLAGDDVEIFYGCQHKNMISIDAVSPTCTEPGNIAYWHCLDCHKLFNDPIGKKENEISDEVIVKPATGHSWAEDWSYDNTYHWKAAVCEHTNLVNERAEHTFGDDNICTDCGALNTVNPTKPYKVYYKLVEYNVNKGDTYLATQLIDNSVNEENHASFSVSDSFPLDDISCPGYEFLGWFTADGVRVTRIDAGTNHDVTLFARWQELQFDITYKLYRTPLAPINDEKYMHYTVSKGLIDLPNPTVYNYVFLGWYTDEGLEVTKIPIGTTGDIVLNAYWTSKRNMARKVSTIEKPIICEDIDNDVIYFAYELGTIENVPLGNPIWTTQNVYGLAQQQSRTVSTTISKQQASTISETISKETVDSATWTLSEDWNNTTSVSESWAEQHGMTVEEAEQIVKTSANTYAFASSSGGNNTTTTTDGTSALSYDSQNKTNEDAVELNAKIEAGFKQTAGANVGMAKAESTVEVSGSIERNHKERDEVNSHTGTDTTKIDTTVSENNSSWNNTSSSSTTNQLSKSTSVSKALSEVISNTKGYGETYSTGGENSESQSFSAAESNSLSTSSTLTYSEAETVTITSTYSSDGKSEGFYRLVLAGTVHVFGVVGYDVASKSYFAYTYNVLDDETHEFLDYSPDQNFNDYENGALAFEVPYFVKEYVDNSTARTEGLSFRTNTSAHTATVSGYSGTDTDVIVPSYISMGGTAYKVTGILTSAFAGKPIESISLNPFIEEIADGAFKNCTALKQISGYFTRIGEEAFKGCTSLENFNVSASTTFIGAKAFSGVPQITVKLFSEEVALKSVTEEALSAAREQAPDASEEQIQKLAAKIISQGIAPAVANAAAASGAQRVVIDLSALIDGVVLTLDVPEIEYFELKGGRNVYTDMKISSQATTTVLEEMTIQDCTRIPLEISSDNLILDAVSIISPSYALLLSSVSTNITLKRDNQLIANSGNAVVCRTLNISAEVVDGADGYLDVSGNVYVYGTINGRMYMDVYNGDVRTITQAEYEKYIKGSFNVYFNANGGTASSDSMVVYYGLPYEELPTATRTGYSFVGWFTEAEGGTQVTEETVFNASSDVVLYARWAADVFTATWNTGTGYSISVNRTASPNVGAELGSLNSGAQVYYGDVLSVTYTPATGYSLGTVGETSITVGRNVTSSDIYATATPNSYTYSIVYKSSNGTSLGSSSATYKFGTTNTITPPAKSGYTTPAAQSVKWDAISKTITFTYPVVSRSSSQTMKTGKWWDYSSTTYINYTAVAEFQNRTSTSIQIRIKWTNTISNGYFGYAQKFNASIGGKSTGDVQICSASTWGSGQTGTRSQTVYSSWITVPISATTTSVSISASWWDTCAYSGSWSNTMTIPTY